MCRNFVCNSVRFLSCNDCVSFNFKHGFRFSMSVLVCETCSIIYDTWIFPKCDSLLSNWKYYRNQTVTITEDDCEHQLSGCCIHGRHPSAARPRLRARSPAHAEADREDGVIGATCTSLTPCSSSRPSLLSTHIINAKWILDHHYCCMIYSGIINGAK